MSDLNSFNSQSFDWRALKQKITQQENEINSLRQENKNADCTHEYMMTKQGMIYCKKCKNIKKSCAHQRQRFMQENEMVPTSHQVCIKCGDCNCSWTLH